MLHNENDIRWMQEALKEATIALQKGEVPIGAVIVYNGQIVGRGHNLRETTKDPLAHAEIIAIKEASRTMQAWRLSDCTLYVTLEPCPMCAGAIVQSRIAKVVFGTDDLKAGCAGTLMNLLQEPRFNHESQVVSGVLQDESAKMLKDFFKQLRQAKKK